MCLSILETLHITKPNPSSLDSPPSCLLPPCINLHSMFGQFSHSLFLLSLQTLFMFVPEECAKIWISLGRATDRHSHRQPRTDRGSKKDSDKTHRHLLFRHLELQTQNIFWGPDSEGNTLVGYNCYKRMAQLTIFFMIHTHNVMLAMLFLQLANQSKLQNYQSCARTLVDQN